MGLTLTPEFRARMESRMKLRLQAPTSPHDLEPWSRRISGLPGDVFLTLAALQDLAESGNRIAAQMWESECKRLGIWVDRKLF